MRIRLSKVRVTDNRPGAGRKPALERASGTRGGSVSGMTGLDHLAVRAAAEAAEHDKWVAGLSRDTLEAVWADLKARPCSDKRDHEQRWVAGRKAAVARAAARMERSMA